jgi:hypothetical protein
MVCLIRAVTLSMTHDESATWLYVHEQSILPSLFNPLAWGTANNHYLNSLFLKAGINLFGDGELQNRYHSVFSFLLYGYWGIQLIQRLYHSSIAKSIALFFIFFNPYLLDFFSLARGYAGATSMLMGGIFFLVSYLDKKRAKDLIFLYVCLIIGSLFLFTHLIFIPIFTLILWWHLFRKKIFSWISVVIPLISSIILTVLTYIPMTTLKRNSEFGWGLNSLWKSLREIVNDSFYGAPILGPRTYGILTLLVLIGILIAVIKSCRESKGALIIPIIQSFLLTLLILVIAHTLLGIQYPSDRKGLIYLPFLCLIIPFVFDVENSIINMYSGFLILMFPIWLFIRNFDIQKTHEWYYDYKTKDFITEIIEDTGGNKASLATHWIFHWTTTYYLKTSENHQISQGSYSKEIDTLNQFDYYLVEKKDVKRLMDKYVPFSEPDQYGHVVLKKK